MKRNRFAIIVLTLATRSALPFAFCDHPTGCDPRAILANAGLTEAEIEASLFNGLARSES